MNIFRFYACSISVRFIPKPVCWSFGIKRTMSSQTDLSKIKDAGRRIVWVDLEMTGLDIEKDHILEVACLVTDGDLNIVACGPDLVIHQPDNILNNMNQWCIEQHGQSGLTQASKNSIISLKEAENQVLNFVKSHVPEKKCPLAGNSVYMDRLFLRKYMPNLNDYMHYRIIDVSTIKELAKRWYSKEYAHIPKKTFKHRAIDDIKESIEEMKYYRKHIFKSSDFVFDSNKHSN